MSDTTELQRIFRLTAIVLPIAILGGMLATAVVVARDFQASAVSYATLTSEDIRDIEFVILPSVDLADVIHKACAESGCDADLVHQVIAVSAANMTVTELEAALEAQARILAENQKIRETAPTGSDAARIASLEIATAARIADLYNAEMRRH